MKRMPIIPADPYSKYGMTRPRIPSGGVYAIENMVTGRVYVGSTDNLRIRLEHHLRHIQGGGWTNARLREDLKRYGPDAFQFQVLERSADQRERLRLERQWAAQLKAHDPEHGYNVTPIRLLRKKEIGLKEITPAVRSARVRLRRAQAIANAQP